ncbi:MAG TPA: hypothetical protein VG318_09515 [Actinomycetota bacterium]|nr:hypothetical protein [Actinomycetota bacterium]
MSDSDHRSEALGFLQLCADRRFHRAVMTAFEDEAGLTVDGYWIEATAGGAPTLGTYTTTARFAYDNGARIMGWAAHGDACGGFPGLENEEIEAKLTAAARERAEELPGAEHWMLFATGAGVRVTKLA